MAAALWLKVGTTEPGDSRRAREWDPKLQQFITPRYPAGHPRAGRPVMERLPTLGHDGSDLHAMRKMRGVKRSETFMRHDGHEVAVALTNAAAHVPAEDTSCATDRQLKARFLGWLPLGCCPLIKMASGEIAEERIESAALKVPGARACYPGDVGAGKPPCEHYLAEKAARVAVTNAKMEARELAIESAAEKNTRAIGEMTSKVAEAVMIVASATAPTAPAKAGK